MGDPAQHRIVQLMLACKGLKLLFVQIFAYKHNVGVALGELVDRVTVPLHDLELRVGYGLKDGELAGEQEALHHELHAAGISLDNAAHSSIITS